MFLKCGTDVRGLAHPASPSAYKPPTVIHPSGCECLQPDGLSLAFFGGIPMRLPRTTVIRLDAVPTQSREGYREMSKDHSVPQQSRESGIQPQGCCGVQVCVPFVGCHCAGIESPYC